MKFILYTDKSGQWRWSLKARNGKLIADCGESYRSKRAALEMCRKINPSIPKETLWNTTHA